MTRSRRAWIYVLSVVALLVPAGGIAYLGAVSYRDERGAIAAQDERLRLAAVAVAGEITDHVEQAVAAVEDAPTTVEHALARYWFWIDASGQLRVPATARPTTLELGAALDRGAPCAAKARLEDCVRELSTRRSRLARLHAAQRAEACRVEDPAPGAAVRPADRCVASWNDARRNYAALAAFADTGPAAQLGLVRVLQRLEDPRAPAMIDELEQRFPDRTFEGLPVPLVVAALRARTPTALAELGARVIRNHDGLDPVLRFGVLSRIRAQLGAASGDDAARHRDALDEQLAEIRREASFAAGLAEDVPELVRTATTAWRGRPAARVPARTLVYRRRVDGGVVGFSVDAPMLEQVVAGPRDELARRAHPLVLPAGATPGPELRRIAQVPLGEALPHLALAIVNPLVDADPRDEVIRERSRRHVMYTSALAIALALGLMLMIRGAARARELAQLKSDFVSTVSHELKTPLTSIRMFAEMLEQGVAQGDTQKMARYHGVIVQESQRLGLLIANLLDYAQIEKGTRRYTPSRHALGQLARHAVTTFETLQDPDGLRNAVELEVSSGAMRAEVEVDRDVVVQAVLNLLANAAKYGGADAPIEVTVGADATAGWIAVTDHGPGIPPTEQARIFREFYRAPEAYRSGIEGTGLGLALVKRHVEAMGGTVEVRSTVGAGSTFTIRIPMIVEAA